MEPILNNCADNVRSRDCAIPIISAMATIIPTSPSLPMLALIGVVIDGLISAALHSQSSAPTPTRCPWITNSHHPRDCCCFKLRAMLMLLLVLAVTMLMLSVFVIAVMMMVAVVLACWVS